MLKLKNKSNFFSILFSIACFFNSNVFADQKTIFINHANTNFPEAMQFKNEPFKTTQKYLKGINLQYYYEWDKNLGFMTSGTYSYNTSMSIITDNNVYKSVLVGPTYRWNEFFSFYAIAGLAHTRHYLKTFYYNEYDTKSKYLMDKEVMNNKHSFSYGIGMIINPVKKLSINLGYERTNLHIGRYDGNINGFIFGLGYSF